MCYRGYVMLSAEDKQDVKKAVRHRDSSLCLYHAGLDRRKPFHAEALQPVVGGGFQGGLSP